MIYIKSFWYHNNEEDPIAMLYEADDNRIIQRFVEIYRNGTADKKNKENMTAIEIVPLPSLYDINSDKQFSAFMIDKKVFNKIWDEANESINKIIIEEQIECSNRNDLLYKAFELLRNQGFIFENKNNEIIVQKENIKIVGKNALEILGSYLLLQLGYYNNNSSIENIDKNK